MATWREGGGRSPEVVGVAARRGAEGEARPRPDPGGRRRSAQSGGGGPDSGGGWHGAEREALRRAARRGAEARGGGAEAGEAADPWWRWLAPGSRRRGGIAASLRTEDQRTPKEVRQQ